MTPPGHWPLSHAPDQKGVATRRAEPRRYQQKQQVRWTTWVKTKATSSRVPGAGEAQGASHLAPASVGPPQAEQLLTSAGPVGSCPGAHLLRRFCPGPDIVTSSLLQEGSSAPPHMATTPWGHSSYHECQCGQSSGRAQESHSKSFEHPADNLQVPTKVQPGQPGEGEELNCPTTAPRRACPPPAAATSRQGRDTLATKHRSLLGGGVAPRGPAG